MSEPIYSQLITPSHSTRLFTLNPGSPDDPITGQLSSIDLQDCGQEWTALSYAWGTTTRDFPITVNASKFHVTEHLLQALSALRSIDQHLVLWVDQICINQEDEEERGAQVMLMDDIYKDAECVIVWLGDSSPGLDLLFQLLPNLTPDVYGTFVKLPDKAFGGDIAIWRRICTQMQAETSDNEMIFKALECLFERNWFQRIWTIQEAVLPRHLYFQVNSSKVASAYLERILNMLKYCGHSSFSSIHHGIFVKPAAIIEVRSLFLDGVPEQVDYPVLLDCTKYRGVTDDRDRVYGLLGLINANHTITNFTPSYKKSVVTIYMEMMYALLQADQSPDPIKFCCTHCKSTYDVPSWCEDWSVSVGCGAQSARSMLKRPRIYFAASQRRYDAQIDIKQRCLRIHGSAIDRISTLVKPAVCGRSLETVWADWRYHFRDTGDLCRAIVADQNTDCGFFSRASEASIKELVEWAESFQPSGVVEALQMLRHSLPHAAARFTDALRLFVVFKSENGLIGQSCRHVEVGDTLALLYGGKLPFILRPSAKSLVHVETITYELVGGECFVTGLADGEGLARVDESNEQYFHIV